MSKTYFKAVHSNGTIHLRASVSGRAYAFAIVREKLAMCASFASKRPKTLDASQLAFGLEIVEAHIISQKEFAAIEKTNKTFCSVIFKGKKFTSSTHSDQARETHAVGLFREAKEVRVELTPKHHQSYHTKYPEGFYMDQVPQDHRVWFGTEEYIRKEYLRYFSQAFNRGAYGYDVIELLDVTQH